MEKSTRTCWIVVACVLVVLLRTWIAMADDREGTRGIVNKIGSVSIESIESDDPYSGAGGLLEVRTEVHALAALILENGAGVVLHPESGAAIDVENNRISPGYGEISVDSNDLSVDLDLSSVEISGFKGIIRIKQIPEGLEIFVLRGGGAVGTGYDSVELQKGNLYRLGADGAVVETERLGRRIIHKMRYKLAVYQSALVDKGPLAAVAEGELPVIEDEDCFEQVCPIEF